VSFQNEKCVPLNECLACGSKELIPVLDLNSQPLANSFKEKQNTVQDSYPLAINRCGTCYHVQLTHVVNPDLMFRDYLYLSSKSGPTMMAHFEWFAKWSTEYYKTVNDQNSPASVLDIGCNDGSQLDKYADNDKYIATFGIDPATNLKEFQDPRHSIFTGYFHDANNWPIVSPDMIVVQNAFAHNFDPLGFLQQTKDMMAGRGLLFIQTSQSDMILNNEFDTIYHEHISFYNIQSMHQLCYRAGLNLIDVVKCPLHGNSYIFVISNDIEREHHIRSLERMEEKAGLYDPKTYAVYAQKSQDIKEELLRVVKHYRIGEGYRIIGYGAAAKGMTLLNYTGLQLDYIIDDSPLKQGLWTPGSSIPVVSSDAFIELGKGKEVMDSYVGTTINVPHKILFIPLAWNFYSEIRMRIKEKRFTNVSNDRFLKYFPNVEVER
jgi:SAM-dependent methyltransferase